MGSYCEIALNQCKFTVQDDTQASTDTHTPCCLCGGSANWFLFAQVETHLRPLHICKFIQQFKGRKGAKPIHGSYNLQ